MKKKVFGRLFFLAALVIIAVLTACPVADSIGDGVAESGPMFEKLGIDDKDKKKIIVFFNTDISGTPDDTKITVKRNGITLGKADYDLTIEKGRLVITLQAVPGTNEQYTVELQAGAVKDANGNGSTANTSSRNKTISTILPSIVPDSLAFKEIPTQS